MFDFSNFFKKSKIQSRTMPCQSPIAIDQRLTKCKDEFDAPLQYFGHWDRAGRAFIKNTGTSAMITFTNRVETPYLVGGPLKNDKYIFEQLHFHWADQNAKGCEHTVDGQQYSMEAHAVHYNSRYKNFEEAVDKEDGLAVTGFFIQASGDVDCLDFKKISDGIQQICRPNSVAEIDPDCLSWLELQELTKHYYTYNGSLTTPPFHESVTWIVYRSPIFVSNKQIQVFRNLCSAQDQSKCILNNYRQIQRPKQNPNVVFVRNAKLLKSKL